VIVRNRSLLPVASYTMAAGIVSGDGTLKAVQLLPRMKNLAPGKGSRQEIRITVTVLVPSDRVAFFVNELSSETGSWKATEPALSEMLTSAARRLPLP
jgi:hypothetical protein